MRKILIIFSVLISYTLPIVIFAVDEFPSEKDLVFVKQEEQAYALFEQLNDVLITLSKRIPDQDDSELYDVSTWENCLTFESSTSGPSGGVSMPTFRKILSKDGHNLNLRMVSYTKELKEAVKLFQIAHGAGGTNGALDVGSGLVGPETRNFLERSYGCARPERIEQRKNQIVNLYVKYLRRLPTTDELNHYTQRQFSLDSIEKVFIKRGKENTYSVNSPDASFSISLSKNAVVLGEPVTIRWLAKNIKVPTATIYVTNLSKVYLPMSESNLGFVPAPWAIVAYDVPVSGGYFVWKTDDVLKNPSKYLPSIVPATDYLIAIEVVQDGKTVRSEVTNTFEIKEKKEIKKVDDMDLNNFIDSKNEDKNIKEVDSNILKQESIVGNDDTVLKQAVKTEKKGFLGSIMSFFKRLFGR